MKGLGDMDGLLKDLEGMGGEGHYMPMGGEGDYMPMGGEGHYMPSGG